jgi:hypothetical protein
VLIAGILLETGFFPLQAQEKTVHERMFHHRSIEAVVWAIPLLNFKQFREGHNALGIGIFGTLMDSWQRRYLLQFQGNQRQVS